MEKIKGNAYYPSKEVLDIARLKEPEKIRQYAENNLEEFWAKEAEELHWFKKWVKVLDSSSAPFYKWFVNGKTNISYNCLDRHLKTYRKNKVALIWEGENGDSKVFSYFALHRETCRFANVLKSLGVQKGDRVTLYLGRIPELLIGMLACARIGAVHSVIYGGFSVEALHERLEDSSSKVLVTADGAFQKGKIIELKAIADEALQRAATVESVLVIKRTGHKVNMEFGRDIWYHEITNLPLINTKCTMEETDAEDPLFILYTSGTTGKPKAILHTHGGYMVGTYSSLKYVMDIRDEDRFWCTADPGWIMGHSMVLYAPFLNGATTFLYEGAPTYPYPNRWWQLVEKYGINILYTSPTAIRGFMRFGDAWVKRHDLSSLRLLGTAGEPINPDVWKWYYEIVGGGKCPIMDTWWQTETGTMMLTSFPASPLKPGSASKAFLGLKFDIFDEKGEPVKPNQEGYLVVKSPWPSMLRTIYKDDAQYLEKYFSKFEGVYLTGDSAKRDEDGYYWVLGRTDEVIKVSGYRLGTAEIENALLSHPAVAEAAAIGLPHDLKGNSISVYLILKSGITGDESLKEEIRRHVGYEVGPIAKPEVVHFVDTLPKTRSGKIMRRLLKAQALGQDPGNISTLEE